MSHEKSEAAIYPEIPYPYRVFYADTDAGGVVYYAQYLRMFEQARGLYIQEFGMSLGELAEKNCVFVCRRAEIEYRSPARLEDRLLIRTRIQSLGHTYLNFQYTVLCENRLDKEKRPLLIAEGMTEMVCCAEKNGELKISRIPKWVLSRLTPQGKS